MVAQALFPSPYHRRDRERGVYDGGPGIGQAVHVGVREDRMGGGQEGGSPKVGENREQGPGVLGGW